MTIAQVASLTLTGPDGQLLVDDVSFAVADGQRLGLVGESGSGKSLTALALLGLLPDGVHASGSVVVDGVEVVGQTERRLRAVRGAVIAPVFQEPLTALDPLMRAGAQIAGPLRRHAARRGERLRGGVLRRAVLDALDAVAIADAERVARAYPWELSGGQRQRVAIAMALACRPRLLVLDEPTTALDVTVQAEVLDLLDTTTRELGTAVLVIGHDLPVVARSVDRVLVLERGRTVETGAVDDVLGAPEHAYTRRLVASARSLQDSLDAARGGAS